MAIRDTTNGVLESVVRLDSPDGPTVQRFDAGSLSNARRTPQGGYQVDASLTRTGIFVYPDGVDYRPPDEVFKADSMATLEGAPVTLLHPPATENRGLVTPETYSKHAKGTSLTPKADTAKGELSSTLFLQDKRLIEAVESGTREISLGYLCRLDATPGVAPDGTKYDRVQRDIRYNHVAVVPYGRAHESGAKVAIRLDSAGNELPPTFKEEENRTMETIRIDGSDYPLGTPAEIKAATSAFNRWQAKLDAAKALADTALSTATARADAAEAKLVKAVADLATATDPARLDAAITARTTLQTQAVAILGKDEAAKLDHGKLKVAIIAKRFPTIKLDGKDAAYIDAMYDAAVEVKADAVAQGNADVAAALGTSVKADAATAPVAPAKKPHEMPLAYTKDAR